MLHAPTCCSAAAGLLLLAACLALPAAAQQSEWPLKLTLAAQRLGDKAVGTATIVNPTKQTIEVSMSTKNATTGRLSCWRSRVLCA
jgi:hypothetical protein